MRRIIPLLCAWAIVAWAQAAGARYLIISPDSYADALRPLAEWKTQKGYKARIVKLSEIGSDSVSIRNYVVNAYNNWQIKPEYLLIVGNSDQVPFPHYNYLGDISNSDNYYANVAADFFNELTPARIWAYDTLQVKAVVAKILHYDRDPLSGDTAWLRQGMTIVDEDEDPNPADSLYWEDTWFLHGFMIRAGFSRIDTFSQNLGHNETDFMNSLNDGRAYIQYRGVGYRTWDFPFWDIDTAQMSNGFMTPIVISATCATTEGIGYEWMFAGSPDRPKGVVGFYGTTTALSNAAGFRSALARGTVSSIFTDSFATLGKAAEAGRRRYYQEYGNTLEYNSWTCQGDPEMSLWTAVPKRISISHDPPAWSGALMVHVACQGAPVESALVCVMALRDSTLYHWGRTNHQGSIGFSDTLVFPDTALVTVTGRNLCPAVDTVPAVQSGNPWTVYLKHSVEDSAGNGNRQPNNGETVDLNTWVVNLGDSCARGLTGVLQKAAPDEYCQLADTVKHFGSLLPLDSASTGPDGYNVAIAPDCPDSHLIRLKLTAFDTTGASWISYFNLRVFSPRPFLILASWTVSDSLSGNNDHQANPGERIELPVRIRNIGDSVATGVQAWLRKAQTDPWFALSDTVKAFGAVLPGDSAWTGMNGYDLAVDSQCPDQHVFKLALHIRDGLDSNWNYVFQLVNRAAALNLFDYNLNDSLKYILSGDTAELVATIANDGSIPAESVSARLIGSDTMISIMEPDAAFGTIMPGGMAGNSADPFIIAARSSAPLGYAAALKLAVAAGPLRDTFDVPVYVGRRDYLVWDPDPDHSSGFVIHQKLTALGFVGDYRQTWRREFLSLYRTLFICLGMAPNKHTVYNNDPVVPEIENYISGGGKAYLEGGDAWWDDPRIGGHDFAPSFKVFKISGDHGTLNGVSGFDTLFTRSMSFRYTGENQSADRINRTGSSRLILKNRTNNYGCGVAADHRTIGMSIELGGLVDSLPPSTKLCLVDSIMLYFGISASGCAEDGSRSGPAVRFPIEAFPNPARDRIVFSKGQSAKGIELKIYDIAGRIINSFTLGPMPSALCWSGTDREGRKVPSGIYFLRLEVGDKTAIRKIVLLR